jgi:hypothetical protein
VYALCSIRPSSRGSCAGPAGSSCSRSARKLNSDRSFGLRRVGAQSVSVVSSALGVWCCFLLPCRVGDVSSAQLPCATLNPAGRYFKPPGEDGKQKFSGRCKAWCAKERGAQKAECSCPVLVGSGRITPRYPGGALANQTTRSPSSPAFSTPQRAPANSCNWTNEAPSKLSSRIWCQVRPGSLINSTIVQDASSNPRCNNKGPDHPRPLLVPSLNTTVTHVAHQASNLPIEATDWLWSTHDSFCHSAGQNLILGSADSIQLANVLIVAVDPRFLSLGDAT